MPWVSTVHHGEDTASSAVWLIGQLDSSLLQGGGLVLQQRKDRREHVDERSEWAPPSRVPGLPLFL